ncbi:porin family protein [Fulvivirga sedimenti]|uniref:PorT family protein n=1 Tax=Fulvivirga sedimenti TaxID=2879465 RepID=A0A9X1HYN2_9BACT|nr:porin family protein [Fulvivirga sedimenti]MCA6078854.1 PorT family protein [Fulvivirga sedimenti]
MKRIPLFFLLLLAVSFTSFGQAGFGVKGGVNFANINIDEASSRTGYHFGVFGDIPLGDHFAIQPEVLFSTQGAKIADTEVDFGYVNIPILLRLKLVKILNIHVGPQVGFVTKAESGGEDIKENVKNADFSIAAGAGISLPLGLEAGARYNIGVSDINNSGIEFADSQHRVFQIYVGWRIFGHK